MNELCPCPECHRHIRRTEAVCPFCAAAVAEKIALTPRRLAPQARLGRAALVTFAAASVGTAACGARTSLVEPDGSAAGSSGAGGFGGFGDTGGFGNSGGNIVVPYGLPAGGFGGGFDTGGTTNIAPPYGIAPPPMGGFGGIEQGGFANFDAAYGAPPPPAGGAGDIYAEPPAVDASVAPHL